LIHDKTIGEAGRLGAAAPQGHWQSSFTEESSPDTCSMEALTLTPQQTQRDLVTKEQLHVVV